MARVRVDVSAAKPTLEWRDVHGPARAVLYALIASKEPDLAQQLHDKGWQGSSLRPAAISPPMFLGTTQRHGVYSTSGSGSVWFGSPVPQIAAALLRAISETRELRWGGARLTVQGTALEWAPDHSSGSVVWQTVSPVLIKRDSRFLLPPDDGFVALLEHNLRHKADILGLPSEVGVEVLDAGPRRVFEVAGAKRVGANAKLRITASPGLLDALYDCGLGLNTVQGFGWVK